MTRRKRQPQPEGLDDEAPKTVESLDDFLREMHGTTTVAEGGMPTLDWLKEHFKTKSAAIRYLHTKGFKVKDISKHLGVRYQHVRNVLTTELKRGPNEPFTTDPAPQLKVPLLKDPYTPDDELEDEAD